MTIPAVHNDNLDLAPDFKDNPKPEYRFRRDASFPNYYTSRILHSQPDPFANNGKL
jgi:hypothetical protein